MRPKHIQDSLQLRNCPDSLGTFLFNEKHRHAGSAVTGRKLCRLVKTVLAFSTILTMLWNPGR